VDETTDDSADGPTDQALRDLLAAEQHRQRVEERRRRHGQRQRADETVSLADILGALAAHGALVSLELASGPVPPSTICEVGRDYVAVRADGEAVRLLPMAAIAAASPVADAPATPPRSGAPVHRGPPLHLAERLRELAARHARVQLAAGPRSLTGRLRRVGLDVAVLELDDGTDVFVSLAPLPEAVVHP